MREKRNILISIGLGFVLGWTLGFLRLPFLEKNHSFLLGFIACFSLVLLGLLIMYIWKKNTLYSNLFRKNNTIENTSKSYSLLWFLVSTIIVVGSLASSFLFFKQIEFSKNQTHHLNKQSAEQLELIASTRRSNALVLMNSLFEKMDKELKNNPKRILSNEIIERIAALNYSFEPYRYLKNSQLTDKKWSPERGQLLLMLAKMNIDSSSFNQLKLKTSFLGADLRGVDLSGADLSNTDLRGANLNNANLEEANLQNANFKKADLQNVNFKKASLRNADLRNTDLRWANFDGGDLSKANLNGANLTSAKLREVDAQGVNFGWADMNAVFFNKAKLMNADFWGTDLSKANLSGANLSDANLTATILSETNLNKANLSRANLTITVVNDDHWFEKLIDWQVVGAKEIQEKYKYEIGKTGVYKFRLRTK